MSRRIWRGSHGCASTSRLSFIAPGGEAFKRDLPDAEIHLLDAGHFALDEKNDEIASLILEFLAKQRF
jgi:hypothetical protein